MRTRIEPQRTSQETRLTQEKGSNHYTIMMSRERHHKDNTTTLRRE